MHGLSKLDEGNGSYSFFPSLLSPLVSETTIFPHYLIPVPSLALIACGTLFYSITSLLCEEFYGLNKI